MKEVLKELYARVATLPGVLYEKAKAYYAVEPARVNAAVAAVVAAVGVPLVVGGVPVGAAIAIGLTILLGGQATRAGVYPQKTVEEIKTAKRKRAAKR